jgi:hypothetical protein
LGSIDETVTIWAEAGLGTEVELAIGRSSDIFPFVENFSYGLVTDFANAAELNVRNQNYAQVAEDAPEITHSQIRDAFLESDMWLGRNASENPQLEYSPKLLPGQRLVVAALAPPGQSLKLTIAYQRSISEQVFGLFGFPACLLLVLGALLLFIFHRQNGQITIGKTLRSLLPKRRGERSDKKSGSILGLWLVLALGMGVGLGGCSSVPKIVESTPGSTISIYPNLTTSQIQNIVDSTISIINLAHDQKKTGYLEQRVSGPALDLRQSQQKVNIALKTLDDISIIPNQLRMVVSDNQTTWPRRLLVITEPTENLGAEKMLTFLQSTPTSLYKLWSVTRVFPNLRLPSLELESRGVVPIDNKTLDLRNKPLEVLGQYANVLEKDETSSYFNNFVDDPLQETMREIVDLSQTQDDNDVQKLTFAPADSEIFGYRTADGGALFFGRIDSEWMRDAGPGRLAIGANDEEEVLLGKQEPKQKITIVYEIIVGIYIPPNGSTNQFQVIAAERYPISVKTG